MIQFPADENKQNVGTYFLKMRQNLVLLAKIFLLISFYFL